jgi:hypothetical protein
MAWSSKTSHGTCDATKQEKLAHVTRLRDAAVRLVTSDGGWKAAGVKGSVVSYHRGEWEGELLGVTPFNSSSKRSRRVRSAAFFLPIAPLSI